MTEKRLRCIVEARGIKEVVIFFKWDIWISVSTPGSNPHKATKLLPDDTGVEEKNINYFTCPVSTVDVQGELLKYDV